MQVILSCFFCLKFLSVVILSAQNVVAAALDTINNTLATETGLINSAKELGNNTIEVPGTVLSINATSSGVFSNTPENVEIDSTTASTVANRNFANGYATVSTGKDTDTSTAALITTISAKNLNTANSIILTSSDNLTTTSPSATNENASTSSEIPFATIDNDVITANPFLSSTNETTNTIPITSTIITLPTEQPYLGNNTTEVPGTVLSTISELFSNTTENLNIDSITASSIAIENFANGFATIATREDTTTTTAVPISTASAENTTTPNNIISIFSNDVSTTSLSTTNANTTATSTDTSTSSGITSITTDNVTTPNTFTSPYTTPVTSTVNSTTEQPSARNNTTEVPGTVLSTTSDLFSNITESLKIDSTTASSTAIGNFANRFATISTGEDTTTTTAVLISTAFSENTTTSNYGISVFNDDNNTTSPLTTNANTTATSTDISTSSGITSLTTDHVTTPNPFTSTNETAHTTPVTTPIDPTTTEQPCAPPDCVNVTINSILKTEVHVTIEAISNRTICPTEINIICNATKENNTIKPWVVPFKNVSFTLNDSNPYGLVIRNLSEFTNYTCDLIHDNLTEPFSIETEKEVPSSPVNLNITVLSSTTFNITWKEPDKMPSVLEGYLLTIVTKYVASAGHIWNNCTEVDTYTKMLSETYFLFTEALADFVYSVTVVAVSDVGNGNASEYTSQTIAEASDPPVNVTFNVTEVNNNGTFNMTLNLAWDIPCNTNGPVTDFQIELDFTYLNNHSRYDVLDFTVPIFMDQSTYSYNISDLWAASNYTVKIYLMGEMKGNAYDVSFQTADNLPSAPKVDAPINNPTNFTIFWREPTNYPGDISRYRIQIIGEGVNWEKTTSCHVSNETYDITEEVLSTMYFNDRVVPDANYSIFVSAETSRGRGLSTYLPLTSIMTYPDPFSVSHSISNYSSTEIYNDSVTIEFQPSCFNGEFKIYEISFIYDDHNSEEELTEYDINQFTFALKPEHFYIVNVTIKNTLYSNYNVLNFTSRAGVPPINNSIISSIPIRTEQTQVSLTLEQKYFDESQGHLRYLAIIIADENITGGSFNRWYNTSQWPVPSGSSSVYYQATKEFWEPFNESDTIKYVIGDDASCTAAQYCNKPLEPGKQYFVFLRLFNNNYYRNTMPVPFVTKKLSRLGVIVGSLAGVLALSIIILLILWRKGYIKLNRAENHGYRDAFEDTSDPLLSSYDDRPTTGTCLRPPSGEPKTEIATKNFVAYCKSLEQNPALLTAQWNELENRSKEIYNEFPQNPTEEIHKEHPHHFATLSENKRKNRYTNILPFDHSRVTLNIDEDDEICSDYINASFIKGYSGENAYIATQGPLSGTCRDFWKMILQERVTVIVMVSRFIENNKDKCYKYFPNNRETMSVTGDDIEVRCSTELHFGFYCIRTLQVKKELSQVTVTHMQFLEWPDFGVPCGTESMLNFCHQFQERWASEGGMAVVHCSAGVGRTGTLIATDILIRAVAAGKKIDVFNTVLELRRQRKSMVQTEKQYMYIYQLIRSMIEFPIADEQDNEEHIYENIELKTKNGIVESSL